MNYLLFESSQSGQPYRPQWPCRSSCDTLAKMGNDFLGIYKSIKKQTRTETGATYKMCSFGQKQKINFFASSKWFLVNKKVQA